MTGGGVEFDPSPLMVLLIDSDPDRIKIVEEGLAKNAVVKHAASVHGRALIDLIGELQPDVLIIDCESPDRDTIEGLRTVAQTHPKPIVMFVEDGDGSLARQAVRAGVSAYIVDGLTPARVQPVIDVAIERFQLVNELRTELKKSKEDLAARKVIERAKGLLMEKRELSEQAAFEAMRSMAMKQGKPLKEVAENIIQISSLLGD
ncbi:MAG: ANTAR domain-containing protein [Pseudomonadota bacterium]